MESTINWQTGTPTENGAYITVKKSKCRKEPFVQEDYWVIDHWTYRCCCGVPTTYLWASIDSIDISEIIGQYKELI